MRKGVRLKEVTTVRNCQDHEYVPHPRLSPEVTCLICYRRYSAAKQKEAQARIRALLNEFKLEKGCSHCGYKEHVAALQFDHITPVDRDGKKWVGPKMLKTAKEMMVDPNIQVLCANCHAIKTRENGDYKARKAN